MQQDALFRVDSKILCTGKELTRRLWIDDKAATEALGRSGPGRAAEEQQRRRASGRGGAGRPRSRRGSERQGTKTKCSLLSKKDA